MFRNKPGGLVVDYLGLADQLKHGLATFTESGGQGNLTLDTVQAVAITLKKHGITCDMRMALGRLRGARANFSRLSVNDSRVADEALARTV